jgi:glycogen operon protein
MQENKSLTDYVKTLIAFRAAHPVLRCPTYDSNNNGTGYPELSFHGTTPWQHSMNDHSLTFAYMYAEDGAKYKTGRDAFLYIAVNAHWEEHIYELPIIPEGMSWKLIARSDAAGDGRMDANVTVPGRITMGPRSTAVLIGERE